MSSKELEAVSKHESVIHSTPTYSGEVSLTKTRLMVEDREKVDSHWWNPVQAALRGSMAIPLENIEGVRSANDKATLEWYREFCDRLKINHKKGVAIVMLKFRWKDKSKVYAFAPKTAADYKMQGSMAMLAVAGGGVPMGAAMYDQQVRTANRWVQWIKEAIRDRKIAVLEEGGLVQAWKCTYCQTLNEAKKEKCSNCGAPRRK